MNEMKNMKKFITLCGFLILGSIACGDADVVKAEAINNQTTDTSGYTITIPSEVSIDKNSGKGSFAVSGKAEAQVDLNVSVSSKNNYKLKNKSQEISYSLDKESFHIDNIKSANSKSFNEDFNITLANTNTDYSGSYEDKLVFDITGNKYVYKLDANSLLDGKVEFVGHDYGSFDVYINGQKVADDVSNFDKVYPYGTEYEFKDLKGTVGHHYSGVGTYGPHWKETPLKGKLGIDAMYYKTDDSPYLLATPCYFKFDTNKLTINYHADGAQTWHHFDNITYDVSGKDIAASETRLFGSHYDGKSGLGDVSRLTKNGYTAKPNTWIVGKNGTKEVSDNVGLAKSQDVAKYCGVLNEFKKNDTTIDLYPIWIPNTYTLTYDLNGGSFNTSTTQFFKYGSGDAISSEIPIKTGYVFTGWRFNEVVMQPGDKIPNNWGNFTLTAQWEKAFSAGTVLNIEETEYTVVEQKENSKYLVLMNKSIGRKKFQSSVRSDNQDQSTYEGSEIDNYLENEWYNSLSSTMKAAIQTTNIKQASYATGNDPDSKQETGYNGLVYNTISRHVFLPSVSEIGKVVDLKNENKVKAFLNNTGIWTRDSCQGRTSNAEYLNDYIGGLGNSYVYYAFDVRPAFVIDLSKVDASVVDTVKYK